jgi:hypothetical protein
MDAYFMLRNTYHVSVSSAAVAGENGMQQEQGYRLQQMLFGDPSTWSLETKILVPA